MSDSELEIFRRFRKDVRTYLAQNLKPAEHYMQKRIPERAVETEHETPFSLAPAARWREYEKHKKRLSALCGYDAPQRKQDLALCQIALSYVLTRLQL